MSGFDNAKVDETFFAGTTAKSISFTISVMAIRRRSRPGSRLDSTRPAPSFERRLERRRRAEESVRDQRMAARLE